MMTGSCGCAGRRARTVSMPFSSGMSTSMVTTSGLTCGNLLQGNAAIGSRADHLDVRIGRQRVGDQPPDDDGVVDDQDADASHAPCRVVNS